MLIVLDNCEHVLDAAAELVDALLAVGGRRSVVLATSREPLEVDGEHVVRLAPLPGSRRRRAVPGTARRPRRATGALRSVHEIAAAVDGLPLALELAAGRARAYTPGRDRRPGPGRRQHAQPDRPGPRPAATTARSASAIHTSYRDLPAPLAALHRAVGAVPGPFTAELAAGLVGDADGVTDAVAGLAHRSLLTPLGPARAGGASRFAQLATVRGHANHEAERAGEDPSGPRNAWVARLVARAPGAGLGPARRLDRRPRRRPRRPHAARTSARLGSPAPSAAGRGAGREAGRVLGLQRDGAAKASAWLRTAIAGVRRRSRARPPGRAGGRPRRPRERAWSVQGQAAEARAQLRAGIAEGTGVTGDDAALVCAS